MKKVLLVAAMSALAAITTAETLDGKALILTNRHVGKSKDTLVTSYTEIVDGIVLNDRQILWGGDTLELLTKDTVNGRFWLSRPVPDWKNSGKVICQTLDNLLADIAETNTETTFDRKRIPYVSTKGLKPVIIHSFIRNGERDSCFYELVEHVQILSDKTAVIGGDTVDYLTPAYYNDPKHTPMWKETFTRYPDEVIYTCEYLEDIFDSEWGAADIDRIITMKWVAAADSSKEKVSKSSWLVPVHPNLHKGRYLIEVDQTLPNGYVKKTAYVELPGAKVISYEAFAYKGKTYPAKFLTERDNDSMWIKVDYNRIRRNFDAEISADNVIVDTVGILAESESYDPNTTVIVKRITDK